MGQHSSIHHWAGKEKDVLMQCVRNSCRDWEELCLSTPRCGVSVHLCPMNPHLSVPLPTRQNWLWVTLLPEQHLLFIWSTKSGEMLDPAEQV